MWRHAKIGILKSVPENIQLSKDLSHQIPCLRVPHSTLNSLRGVKGQQQQHRVQSLQRQVANALVDIVQSLANALGKCQFVVNLPQKRSSQFGVTAPACTQEILFTGSKLVLGESVWDKGYEFSLSMQRAWWEIKSWVKWLRSYTVGISLSSMMLPVSAKVISILNLQNPEVIKKARNSAICTYVFGPREY